MNRQASRSPQDISYHCGRRELSIHREVRTLIQLYRQAVTEKVGDNVERLGAFKAEQLYHLTTIDVHKQCLQIEAT
jgi:hypothetical protein